MLGRERSRANRGAVPVVVRGVASLRRAVTRSTVAGPPDSLAGAASVHTTPQGSPLVASEQHQWHLHSGPTPTQQIPDMQPLALGWMTGMCDRGRVRAPDRSPLTLPCTIALDRSSVTSVGRCLLRCQVSAGPVALGVRVASP